MDECVDVKFLVMVTRFGGLALSMIGLVLLPSGYVCLYAWPNKCNQFTLSFRNNA